MRIPTRELILSGLIWKPDIGIAKCELKTRRQHANHRVTFAIDRESPSYNSGVAAAWYGELAADAAKLDVPVHPQLKSRDQYTIVGKAIPRIDIPSKVDGSAKYGIDVDVPGMLYATIAAAPVFGAKLGSVDTTQIAALPGIRKVVKLDNAVAVVADRRVLALRDGEHHRLGGVEDEVEEVGGLLGGERAVGDHDGVDGTVVARRLHGGGDLGPLGGTEGLGALPEEVVDDERGVWQLDAGVAADAVPHGPDVDAPGRRVLDGAARGDDREARAHEAVTWSPAGARWVAHQSMVSPRISSMCFTYVP